MRAWILAALLLPGASCQCRGQLRTDLPSVSVTPTAVSVTAYLGATSVALFTASNGGEGGDEITLTLSGDPSFELDASSPIYLEGGQTLPIRVAFNPTVAGQFLAALRVTYSSGQQTLGVTGTALADLPCPAAACTVGAFDADAGICKYMILPDGDPCNGPLCLINTRCSSGLCVGDPDPCDDENVCTTDACVSGVGCQHQDNSDRCQGNEPCQVYGCDPTVGCTRVSAPEGTACASTNGCQRAGVCAQGICTGLAVANGTPCSIWWAPCVRDAFCQEGVCDSPTADLEVPGQLLWQVAIHNATGPFAVIDGGVGLFAGSLSDDSLPERALLAVNECGDLLWTNDAGDYLGALDDGDQLVAWTNSGTLLGLERATGAQLWSVDVAAALATADQVAGRRRPAKAEIVGPAMTEQGLIYVVAQVQFEDDGGLLVGALELLAAFRDGTVAWGMATPFTVFPMSGGIVDRLGNYYLLGCDSKSSATELWSVSPAGEIRLKLGADGSQGIRSGVLVSGLDFLFETNSSKAVLLDGGLLYTAPGTSSSAVCDFFGDDDCSEGAAVVSASGIVYANEFVDAGVGGVVALSPEGNLLWSSTTSSYFSLILADDETIFYRTISGLPGTQYQPTWGQIGALSGDGGSLLWSSTFQDVGGFGYETHAALTENATFLTASPVGIYGFFAGQHRPATSSWSRQRGGNSYRGCLTH